MASDDAIPDDLIERVSSLVAGWEVIEEVTMFGLPSFTAAGELFCVVSEQGLALTRLPPAERDALADLVDVVPFDAGGRTVDRWATVAPAYLPDDETLVPFVRASYEAALDEAAR